MPPGEARYYVRLRGPDGKVRNKAFRTLREAEAYERAQRSARDRGVWTDPRAGRTLLKEYAAAWLPARTVRGKPLARRTVKQYQYLLDDYILPTFGNVGMSQVEKGAQERTDPKSEAGKRLVTLPPFVVAELRQHLVAYVPANVDAPVFVGRRGGVPRRRNWSRTWSKARRASGVPNGVHLHDLRHMGATLSAQSGGTTKELMARLGHSTSKAALIYQHAVEERDQAIALALDEIGRRASERSLPREDRAKRA